MWAAPQHHAGIATTDQGCGRLIAAFVSLARWRLHKPARLRRSGTVFRYTTSLRSMLMLMIAYAAISSFCSSQHASWRILPLMFPAHNHDRLLKSVARSRPCFRAPSDDTHGLSNPGTRAAAFHKSTFTPGTGWAILAFRRYDSDADHGSRQRIFAAAWSSAKEAAMDCSRLDVGRSSRCSEQVVRRWSPAEPRMLVVRFGKVQKVRHIFCGSCIRRLPTLLACSNQARVDQLLVLEMAMFGFWTPNASGRLAYNPSLTEPETRCWSKARLGHYWWCAQPAKLTDMARETRRCVVVSSSLPSRCKWQPWTG